MDLTAPLNNLEKRFDQLLHELSGPMAAKDPFRFQQLSREHARLKPVVEKYQRYKRLLKERGELEVLARSGESDLQQMVAEDMRRTVDEIQALDADLRVALLPRDPNE